jgi:CubicO group peptidase (beta-lactamase class C family)
MKIKMRSIALTLPLVILANAVFATEDFSAINRYVTSAKKEIGLPSGTAIAIVKGDSIIYEGYFGYANIKEKKKVTDKTAFYIASITKPMFALSTLLMVNEGAIKDTTSMAEMFPKQDFSNFNAEQIQLKHLVSHTSGIENWPLVATLAYTGNHDNAQRHKLVAASTYNEKSKLGVYEYSNLGFNIVSVWAEDYYKQDWQKTLSELVYEPLGMVRTSSYMSDAAKKGFEVARPYELKVKDPNEIYSFEKSDATMHGAGGTITTVSDTARFLIAQLNKGFVDGKQIFPAEVIKKSHEQLAVNNLKYRDFVRTGYAWGWYMGPYKGEDMYHHFGGVAGTHAHSSYMLKHDIGLVVFNNESVMSSKLTNAIADIAYSILLKKGNADEKADMHIKEMQKAWGEMEPKLQASMERAKKRDAERVMMLSQNKANYIGVFHNELWGELKVELLDLNKFKFTLGQLSSIAAAYTKPDSMRIEFSGMTGGKVATYDVIKDKVQGIKFMGEYFSKR